MEKQKGYNGWSSYSAWNVALWLANEESDYMNIERMKADAIKFVNEHKFYSRLSEQEKKAKIQSLLSSKVIREYEGCKTGDGVRMSKKSLKEYVASIMDD